MQDQGDEGRDSRTFTSTFLLYTQLERERIVNKSKEENCSGEEAVMNMRLNMNKDKENEAVTKLSTLLSSYAGFFL